MSKQLHGLWSLIRGAKSMKYEFYKDSKGKFKTILWGVSHSEVARKCVHRYFRMFVKNKTVGNYNNVVRKVCERIYSNWHRRGEHLTINARSDGYKMVWNIEDERWELKRDFWRCNELSKKRLAKWKATKFTKSLKNKFKRNRWKHEHQQWEILYFAWDENERRNATIQHNTRLKRYNEMQKARKERKTINKLIKNLKGELKNNEKEYKEQYY